MDRHDLRPELAGLAERQWGVFTRAQALAAGYSEGEIRSLSSGARAAWSVIRRGAYLTVEQRDRLDDREWLWRGDVAAHLTMREPHALSHDSAARAWGIPVLDLHTGLAHVTRRGVGGSRTRHGVKHHLGREAPARILEVGGLVVTGPARTALDLAREHGFEAGVIAIDHVLREGTTLREFELELARMTRWPYVRTSRAALAFADPGAESVGESLTRVLLAELGAGHAETQFPVPVGGGVRWCDLRVERQIVEFDGFVKLVQLADGGVATEDPSVVAFRDRQRDTEIGHLGLGVSHVTWPDLFSGRAAAKARLRRELALTRDRFGTDLPEELVRFAREHPRRRAA